MFATIEDIHHRHGHRELIRACQLQYAGKGCLEDCAAARAVASETAKMALAPNFALLSVPSASIIR